jgi:hypothetical protein
MDAVEGVEAAVAAGELDRDEPGGDLAGPGSLVPRR